VASYSRVPVSGDVNVFITTSEHQRASDGAKGE
jgi:hypothetical protein